MLTVYSKYDCGFCVKAKNLLDSLGVRYEEIDVHHDHEARDFLKEQGLKTVPQIFKGDILIGGFTDLVQKQEMVL